jgi:hypothetical protein
MLESNVAGPCPALHDHQHPLSTTGRSPAPMLLDDEHAVHGAARRPDPHDPAAMASARQSVCGICGNCGNCTETSSQRNGLFRRGCVAITHDAIRRQPHRFLLPLSSILPGAVQCRSWAKRPAAMANKNPMGTASRFGELPSAATAHSTMDPLKATCH